MAGSGVTTALITHKECLGHEPPSGHPEQVKRLEKVLAACKGFEGLVWEEAPLAEAEHLVRVHEAGYVESVLGRFDPEEGRRCRQLNPETYASAGSAQAALRAAGSVMRAVDMVVAGDVDNAFCAVRPPGHHAEAHTAMGFCLFNNVAVAAAHAREVHGIKRVAVMDFDVHHGNGTQAMFWHEPDWQYLSTHQVPLYPGTGMADERGVGGNIVNVPLSPGADGEVFRGLMAEQVLPALREFAPELLIVSAGFDAHHADPLAQVNLEEADYVWASEQLVEVARSVCGGRLVSALEGGYNLEALAASAAAHVGVLMAA